MSDRIGRKYIGTRVSFSLAAIVCYAGTLAALAFAPDLSQPEAWAALEWLVGMLAVAIIGDTARPSGMKGAAFGLTAAPKGADEPKAAK